MLQQIFRPDAADVDIVHSDVTDRYAIGVHYYPDTGLPTVTSSSDNYVLVYTFNRVNIRVLSTEQSLECSKS